MKQARTQILIAGLLLSSASFLKPGAAPVARNLPEHETRLALNKAPQSQPRQFTRFYSSGEPLDERLIYEPKEDLPFPTGGLGFEPAVCRHQNLSKDLEFKMCRQQLLDESD